MLGARAGRLALDLITNGRPLPPGLVEVLIELALAEPPIARPERAGIRLPLTVHPSVPLTAARTLAGGAKMSAPYAVAFYSRADLTEADVARLAKETRGSVLEALAEGAQAAPAVFEDLAGRDQPPVLAKLMTNPATPPAAALRALETIRARPARMLPAKWTLHCRENLHHLRRDTWAAVAAVAEDLWLVRGLLEWPALLDHEAVDRLCRIDVLDVINRDSATVQPGRQVSTSGVEEFQRAARHAGATVRRELAQAAAAAGVLVNGQPAAYVLGVNDPEGGGPLQSAWPELAAGGRLPREVLDAVTGAVGHDAAAARVLFTLAETFTGTARELLDVTSDLAADEPARPALARGAALRS